MRSVTLGILLLTLCLPSWSSELYTPQAVLHSAQDKVVASVKFDRSEKGDMYVATIVGGELLFLSQAAGWTKSPLPFMANKTFKGEVPLFSVEAGLLPHGNYPLYQVVTVPNGNPLNVDDWIGGFDGLNLLTFSVGLPKNVRVLAFNDLGMHCMDKDFSVLTILPPFNVVNAQVIEQEDDGEPKLLNSDKVEVRYSAVSDRRGSINSSSVAKTDFWQYAQDLFGMDLQAGEGLTGLYMPADHPGTQELHYNTKHDWFSAEGVPITPIDDNGQSNPYSMLRVSAHDKNTGALLGAIDVVVPVSTDVSCSNCHATGKIAADNPAMTWASDDDLEVQAKKNILMSHDKQHGTNLQNSTPVLCASCHYSPGLDLEGKGPQGIQKSLPTASQVMHKFHGELSDAEGNPLIPSGNDVPVEQSCYQCHPGKTTQCQRGAMKTVGLECTSCHGGLLAVGGKFPLQAGGSLDGNNDGHARRSWLDMPRCQSCHTGDAVNHLTGDGLEFYEDGIRLVQSYKTGDQSASPLLAENKRFAENDNTLYRNSKGHSGVACEACHGSTHAIWPNADPNANDNLTAIQLQGHSGTVIECDSCHAKDSLDLTMAGPHGLHNVNDSRWTNDHEDFYKADQNACKACHGKDLKGTPLSKMAVTRNILGVVLKKGQEVSCDFCHAMP